MEKSLEKLVVEIEPGILDVSEDEEKSVKRQILGLYTHCYHDVMVEYKDSIVEGTGYKTNRYGEPTMNLAYNYIRHRDFYTKATERGKSYDYWRSVWDVACERVCKIINDGLDEDKRWRIKLDHLGLKNNDFYGRLIVFRNDQTWWRANGFEDMRP